jgi:hypothetical protein
MGTTYLNQVKGLRAGALLSIELEESRLGCGHLSLFGQPSRLIIDLPTGEKGVVRFISTGGDTGEDGELDVIVDVERRSYFYRELSTEALAACADYASRMEDIYHDDETIPDQYYRRDALFTAADRYPVKKAE